jgi:hypothetical protein
MRRHIEIILLLLIASSCSLPVFDNESKHGLIQDFTWSLDSFSEIGYTYAYKIVPESFNDFWIISNGRLFRHSKTIGLRKEPVAYRSKDIIQVKDNQYIAFEDGLFKANLAYNFRLLSSEALASVIRTERHFSEGSILEMAAYKGAIYLLCTYKMTDEWIPSYTTILKWNGSTLELLYTSDFGFEGTSLVAGENGVYVVGNKYEIVEHEYFSTSYSLMGMFIRKVSPGGDDLFMVTRGADETFTLGLIGKDVYVQYEGRVCIPKDGKLIQTSHQLPFKDAAFCGFNLTNLVATSTEQIPKAYDGTIWIDLDVPATMRNNISFGAPVLAKDGIIIPAISYGDGISGSKFVMLRGHAQ